MSRTARMTEREANILAERVTRFVTQNGLWDVRTEKESVEDQATIVEILLGEIEDA